MSELGVIPGGRVRSYIIPADDTRVPQVAIVDPDGNPISDSVLLPEVEAPHIYNNLTNGVTANAVANFAAAPEYFEWQATVPSRIYRMIVYIQGSGTLSASGYGTISGGLTNGIALSMTDSSDVQLLNLTSFPVQSNAVWGAYCFDAVPNTYGNGDNALTVRWTFSNSGRPLVFRAGDKLRVYLSDDLSALTLHTFHIQGYEI